MEQFKKYKMELKRQQDHSISQANEFQDQNQMIEGSSEFLNISSQMKNRLNLIDQNKAKAHPPKANSLTKLQKDDRRKQALTKLINAKGLDKKVNSKLNTTRKSSQGKDIRRQFLGKLKSWSLQKEQLQFRRKEIHEKNERIKGQKESKRKKEEEEQQQFNKLQKKKILEKKINDIEERRRKRQESLKNAVMKRSYNVPKYLQYEQKFIEKEQEKVVIDMKLIKSKKQKMKMNPEQLRAHEKAYIDRIKERLNMNVNRDRPKGNTKSDFNVYIKRTQQLKKAELDKMIKMKKFQEKISKMPIAVDEAKKVEASISKDKAQNPLKYHFLSQKSLNDRQIFDEFQEFDINSNHKEVGNKYLKQLKHDHKKVLPPKKSHSSVQLQRIKDEPKKPISKVSSSNLGKMSIVKPKKSQKSQFQKSLLKSKQKDNKFVDSINKKLNNLG